MVTFRRLQSVWRCRAILIHPYKHGCSFKQLHLLMLGDEQFGSVGPLRRVLPSVSSH